MFRYAIPCGLLIRSYIYALRVVRHNHCYIFYKTVADAFIMHIYGRMYTFIMCMETLMSTRPKVVSIQDSSFGNIILPVIPRLPKKDK